jgi:hypothetical protein
MIITASIQLQSYYERIGLPDVDYWTDLVISTLERVLIKQTFQCLLSFPPLKPDQLTRVKQIIASLKSKKEVKTLYKIMAGLELS